MTLSRIERIAPSGAEISRALTRDGFVFSRELAVPASMVVSAAGPSGAGAAAYVDVAPLVLPVTVGELPVYPWVKGAFQFGKGTAATGDRAAARIALLEDGVVVHEVTFAAPVPATLNTLMPFHLPVRRTPAPGDHVYKVQVRSEVASPLYTITLVALATAPWYLGAREGAF